MKLEAKTPNPTPKPTPKITNIQQLEQENKALKDLVKEGKSIFKMLNDTLGLEAAAKSNFFMAKMASIVRKVQRNPEIFNDIITYSQKINAININDDNA